MIKDYIAWIITGIYLASGIFSLINLNGENFGYVLLGLIILPILGWALNKSYKDIFKK